MRVGVIDVGSNTARLLVASGGALSVTRLHEERALLALGDEVERFGSISDVKLAETAERARRYAQKAIELGCSSLSVIVTAPGRQSANGEALVGVLDRATGVPARVLSTDEEGRLAFIGAIMNAEGLPQHVAVCDVGGGSTEVAIGTVPAGPDFCRSLDVGSLRITRRLLDDDPPGKKAVARARVELERAFEGLEPPVAEAALASGGTARALRRVSGTRRLGREELRSVARLLSKRTSAAIAREFGLDPVRARTLLAGTLILAEAERRLGIPLEVARGGLREGAAAMLLARAAAA